MISEYFKSRSANIATAGALRLANTDLIEWRNFANSGNNTLGMDSSNRLVYNGTPLEFDSLTDSHIFVGNASNEATDVAMTGDIGISNTGVTAIQSGVIVNADINASAAIAYTKLNLTGSILNSDIYSNAGIAYSKLNLTNGIVNADINTAAAIAYSKLAPLTSAHLLIGSAGNVATDTALSGDATLANTGALTLATVNSNVGSFTYSNITVNAKGLITAASSGTFGNLTDAGTDGITVTGGTGAVAGSGTSLSQHVADSTHNGYLSSTDWSTFNSKQAAGNYITALTGDVTATGPGSVAATLATVNANVGSFGSSTAIPSFTVNGKGLITAASTNVVIAPAGTLTGTTLASNVVTSSLTSVGTISTGVWNGTAITVPFGGTGLTTLTQGDILYASASNTLSALAKSTTATRYLANTGTSNNPAWDQVNLANGVTGTLAVGNGGTGQTSYTDGQLLIGNTSGNTLTKATLTGTANQITVTNGNGSITLSTPQSIGTGSSPTFAGLTLSSPLTVPNGGTGDSSLTAYAVLCGGTTSTAAVQSVAALGSSGQVLTSNGAGALPTFQSVSGSGTVNSGTANQIAYYAASSAAVSGTSVATVGANSNLIISGTNTNDSATSGKVGEYVESVVGQQNLSTGAYINMTSISLTAGDWDVTAVADFNSNGATFTTRGNYGLGISNNSTANSFTDKVAGSNGSTFQINSTTPFSPCITVASYRVSLSSTTTYYAKAYVEIVASGTPVVQGRLSARRMR